MLLECNHPKLLSKDFTVFKVSIAIFRSLIFWPEMEEAVHTFTNAGFLLQTQLLLALGFCCLLGAKAAKSTLFVFKPQ